MKIEIHVMFLNLNILSIKVKDKSYFENSLLDKRIKNSLINIGNSTGLSKLELVNLNSYLYLLQVKDIHFNQHVKCNKEHLSGLSLTFTWP